MGKRKKQAKQIAELRAEVARLKRKHARLEDQVWSRFGAVEYEFGPDYGLRDKWGNYKAGPNGEYLVTPGYSQEECGVKGKWPGIGDPAVDQVLTKLGVDVVELKRKAG